MRLRSDQQPCARRSSAARLSGVRGRLSPFGETNICPAGSKIETANEITTTKNKSNAIGILIIKTAAANVRVLSIVNDYSCRSVSGGILFADSNQRERPPFPAALVSEGLPLGGNATRQCGACPRRKHCVLGFNSDHDNVCGSPPMIAQRKRPLFPAAQRWGLRPFRGNDASGRNDRVFLNVVTPTRLRHPSLGQAAMRCTHPFGLESAALTSTRKETGR